ncbi:hypothetical protein BZB76_0853 [Actinomadura pelletieri DSM 43383]|uniref:Uncharacterized protein n=1 Tax=Actinomadura pelletieri DSM 43383 TaxID=1120940 RepID=A0A495QZC4_9ACTN|nr:hypothetical protein [Actinomadura pelletieri]RKS79388.1 hypothetical protein BZB76_0853 [Actinomadura pelletieri DSM 43383]
MKRTGRLTLLSATVALSLLPGHVAAAAPTPKAPFCYEEPSTPAADISDLKSRFSATNWMPTLQEMYRRRWPSGEKLAIAQEKDKYWDQFVNKRNFEGFAESMMVAIHEETHMWDLDPARTRWDVHIASWINASQQATAVPLHGGFPRREILPLITDKLSDSMDGIYLRDSQQGTYKLQGVLAELNAGLMGLPAATVVQEYIKGVGASNSRDIAATNLRYLLLYLRTAKDKHPDYWAKIKNEPKLRELVLIQFLRTAYWLDKSAPYADKLGSPDADKITASNYSAPNLAIVEEFTGATVRRDTDKHCTT